MTAPPAMLQHSTAKLWRTAGFGAAFALLALWMDTSVDLAGEGHGRGAWLVGLLGETGTRIFFALFGLAALALALLSVRLVLQPDRMAARADADGVTVRTLGKTQHLAWGEIADLTVDEIRPAGRPQYFLTVRAIGRRDVSLAASTVEGGSDAIVDWINAAAAFRPARMS